MLESVIEPSDARELSALTAKMDRVHGTDYVHEEAYARHIMNLPGLDEAFLALIDHEPVLSLLEHLLGPDLILGSMNARNVRPGDPDQPLHSDIPPTLRKLDLRPIMYNVTWLFDGFSEENGATRFVSGSHLSPHPAPPEGLDVPHQVQPEGPPGSVLIFNGQIWHGGGANRSAEVRHAVFAHYRAGPWMRFQCDPHVRFPREYWRSMNDRQRKLLRMEQGVGQPNAAAYSVPASE